MRRHLVRRRPLLRRVGRQQQPRLQEREPGRHHQVVGRELDPQPLRRLDEAEVLLGEPQDRDPPEVDLLAARQRQQEVERSLEAVEVDDQRLGRQPLGRRSRRRRSPQACARPPIAANSAASAAGVRLGRARRAAPAPPRPARSAAPAEPRRRLGHRRHLRRRRRCSAAPCRSPPPAPAPPARRSSPVSACIDRSSVIRSPPKPISSRISRDHPRRLRRRRLGVERRVDHMRRHRHRQVGERPERREVGRQLRRRRLDPRQLQVAVERRRAPAPACA